MSQAENDLCYGCHHPMNIHSKDGVCLFGNGKDLCKCEVWNK